MNVCYGTKIIAVIDGLLIAVVNVSEDRLIISQLRPKNRSLVHHT